MKFLALFIGFLVLAAPVSAIGPKLTDAYKIEKIVVHQNDNPEAINAIVDHVSGTSLELLLMTLEWERQSHGELGNTPATKENLENLRLGTEGLNTLSMFLRHTVLAPKPALAEFGAEKKILLDPPTLSKLIQRFTERMARRVKEMERWIAAHGEEPPRPARLPRHIDTFHLMNIARPTAIPPNYLLPPRVPANFLQNLPRR